MTAVIKRRRPRKEAGKAQKETERPAQKPAQAQKQKEAPPALDAMIKQKHAKAKQKSQKPQRRMITVPPDVHERLASLSKRTGVSMSKLVGYLLDETEDKYGQAL